MRPILHIITWFPLFTIFNVNSRAQEISQHVYLGDDGFMHYTTDQEGNFIPDFSYAGYKYGQVPIPDIPVIKSIEAIASDNTDHIQNAIDEIAEMAIDEDGFRGALQLGPGIYPIHGIIRIPYNGIVLRGKGSGSEPNDNTVIVAIGNDPPDRDVIQIGGATGRSWSVPLSGSIDMISSDYLPLGVKTLNVGHIDRWRVGDEVMILHPSTDAWLRTINYGDTESDEPWESGDLDIYYNRIIRSIDSIASKIVLDVPIYDHLDRRLAQTIIYKPDRQGIRSNIAVEDLRIVIETQGEEDEQHAKNGIRCLGVEDCWVRNVTALHFTYAGIDTRMANRISIVNCTAIEPHSQITGARRYNFAVGNWSNNILFQNCKATEGRHSFVSNGTSSVSGIVFHNCTSDIDYNLSEGHRRWSQALLFDNIVFTNPESRNVLGLYNRGDFGTGHGWASVHSVAWGVRVPLSRGIIVQKPPLRQNYAIGCRGVFSNPAPFNQHPRGIVELPNKSAAIASLYEEQLLYRLQGKEVLDVPAKLKVNRVDSLIALEWLDISSAETEYVVEYSIDGQNNFELLEKLPPNSTTLQISDREEFAKEIYFRVYCLNSNGISPYSNLFILPGTTGSKHSTPVPIEIIPNPVDKDFRVISTDVISEIRVSNMAGRQIFANLLKGNIISCRDWPPGVYTVTIRNPRGQLGSKRIVKF